jgi:hypothetical protein
MEGLMKKSSALLLLVVCLATTSPVYAARSRDAANVRSGQTRIERLVHAITNLGVAVQSWYIGTPKP